MAENHRPGSRKRLSLTGNIEHYIPRVRPCCKSANVSVSVANAEDTERSQLDMPSSDRVYKTKLRTAGLVSHEAVRFDSDTRHHGSGPAPSQENVSKYGKTPVSRSHALSPCYLSGQPSEEWTPQDEPVHEVPDCLPECSHLSKAPTAASVFAPVEPSTCLHGLVQRQHGQHYSTLLSAPGFSYGGEYDGEGYVSDGAISLGSRGTDNDDADDQYEGSAGDRTDEPMIGGFSDLMRHSCQALQQPPLFGSLKGRRSEVLEANNVEGQLVGSSGDGRAPGAEAVALGGGAAKDGHAAPASLASGLPPDVGCDMNVFSSAAAFAAAAAATGGAAGDPPRTHHSSDNDGFDGDQQLYNQMQIWSEGSWESVASANPAASVDLASLGSRAQEVCDVQATAAAPPAAAPVSAPLRGGMGSGPASLSLSGWGAAHGLVTTHGNGRLGQDLSSFPFPSPFTPGAGGAGCTVAVRGAGSQHVAGAAAAGMATAPSFGVAAPEPNVGAGASAAPSAQPSLPPPVPSLLPPEVYLGIVMQMVTSVRAVAAGAATGAMPPVALERTSHFLPVYGPAAANMAAATAAAATRHYPAHAPTGNAVDGVLPPRDRSVTDSVGEA